jgi:hypothetical protein
MMEVAVVQAEERAKKARAEMKRVQEEQVVRGENIVRARAVPGQLEMLWADFVQFGPYDVDEKQARGKAVAYAELVHSWVCGIIEDVGIDTNDRHASPIESIDVAQSIDLIRKWHTRLQSIVVQMCLQTEAEWTHRGNQITAVDMAQRPLETRVQVEVVQQGRVRCFPDGGLHEKEEVRLDEAGGSITQMVVQPESKAQSIELMEQMIDTKVQAEIERMAIKMAERMEEMKQLKRKHCKLG